MTASVDLAPLVLHRNADLLVIDKPAGIPVHRSGGTVAALEDGFDSLRFGLKWRPELAHRLDRETSGCLVLGRHPAALRALNALFAEGGVAKTYWAVVAGAPIQSSGRIEQPLLRVHRAGKWSIIADPAGQQARTVWRVLAQGQGRAWLELEPETGRTHQLRIHCAEAGWPILGDRRYGVAGGPLMLHARRVRFAWRRGEIDVTAPAPASMQTLLDGFNLYPGSSPT